MQLSIIQFWYFFLKKNDKMTLSSFRNILIFNNQFVAKLFWPEHSTHTQNSLIEILS